MSLDIIKKYNIKAKKSLGQNFLVDEEILDKISSFLGVKGQNIVEVGPGYGALTQRILVHKPLSLTLIELDKNMIRILEDRMLQKDLEIDKVQFKVENQDILKYKPDLVQYSVVANIPYYITSPILRHFIYNVPHTPETMMILMQKDVGDKVLGCGKNKSSVIRLFVQKKYHPEEILTVQKESFIPPPKVESSILFFKKHDLYNFIDDDIFLKLIKIGFSANRKKLFKNFISGGLSKNIVQDIFDKNQINQNVRAEDLSIDIWSKIISDFISFGKL